MALNQALTDRVRVRWAEALEVATGARAKNVKHAPLLAAEGTGDTLALTTWVAFGAGAVGQVVEHLSWPPLRHTVLRQTRVRMLPVYFSLGEPPLHPNAKLFIGCFGPRWLASIVLNSDLPGGSTLAPTVFCTVALSNLLHGLIANPLVAAFGRASYSDGEHR